MNTKKLILPFVLSLVTFSSFASVDLGDYQNTIAKIKSLEAAGNFTDASLVASQAALEIAKSARFDETVVTIENVINIEQDEVITETHNRTLEGSAFFGLFGFKSSRSWDVAKIVNSNPDEVLRSQREEGEAFLKLKKDLVTYVGANELAIFYAKIFAAKAAQLIGKMPSHQSEWLLPFVTKTIAQVSAISFFGAQHVTTCVTTEYEERENARVSEISGILSLSSSQVHTRQAFSETKCDSKTNSASVKQNNLLMAKLFSADQILKQELKILSFRLMQTAEAPNYPTWGLGYLEGSGVERARPSVIPTGTRRHY